MKKIVLCGWKAGLKKVSLTLLLRDKASYSLREAKGITDALIAGKPVTIELSDNVESILSALTNLGVVFIRDGESK